MSFLERLRTQPDVVKTQIAFGTAFVIAGSVAAVWATTLPARFSGAEIAVETAREETTESNSIFQPFTNAFKNARHQLGSASEALNVEDEYATPTERGSMPSDESWRDTLPAEKAHSILIATTTVSAKPSTQRPASPLGTRADTATSASIILIGTSTEQIGR